MEQRQLSHQHLSQIRARSLQNQVPTSQVLIMMIQVANPAISANYSEDDLKQVNVTVRRLGGPDDVDDNNEWREKLIQHSSLWRVISRSSTPKPIWELLDKYQDIFHNHFLLAHAMEEAWHRETGLPLNLHPLEGLRRDFRVWTELNKEGQSTLDCLQDLSTPPTQAQYHG